MTSPVSGPVTARPARRATAAGLLALTCALGGLAAPSAAASADPVRRTADCAAAAPATVQARTGRALDTPVTPPAVLRSLARELDVRLLSSTLTRTATTPAVVHVQVHAHAIGGATAKGASKQQVQRQLDVLNRAYRGGEAAAGVATPFRFELASFERVRNERWRTAGIDTTAERQMRRALHTGGRAALDLYVARPAAPGDGGGQLLGWSSAPWDLARHPHQDGVTIHQGTLPGGPLQGYDKGDTAVHEVGHWLGLLHTFESGCDAPGDLVADTPAEAEPSSTCDPGKDTCTAPGTDPVHNFMDYAVDPCMDRFTAGQVHRMTDNWLAYRTP